MTGVGTRLVFPLSWRRLRWLKRRGMVVYPASFGPPCSRPSQVVDCVDAHVGCFRSHVDVVDADEVVDGKCDGHQWCHKSINIGHSTRRRFNGSVTTCLSSGPSSVCPPLVRPAPGSFACPSSPVPLPPAHSALVGDYVGSRVLSFDVGASVAQPCLSFPSGSAGSSAASLDSFHSAGPRSLSSRSVASTRRSVGFLQSKSGNVSAQGGRRIVVASVGSSGKLSTTSSSKVVLHRQVIVVDLGFASVNVATHSGAVVGSVSGRQ